MITQINKTNLVEQGMILKAIVHISQVLVMQLNNFSNKDLHEEIDCIK